MEDAPKPAPRGRPRCGAKRRDGTGETCRKGAGAGTEHRGTGRCALHGGATESHKAAAQRTLAERAVKTYGLALDINPVDALLDEVRWTAGHVAWLRERVQEIEREALVWGRTEVVDKGAGEFIGVDTTEAAKPNVWLSLYQVERKHLVDVCKTAIGAGLAERQVRMAEAAGEQLVQVIRAILDDLGLSPAQRALAVESVPRRLRAVA
jgi:hypothetical protein